MTATISKDTPLAEITLRRYEKPSDIKDRDLVRKICLSIGLLQPGDSRDIIVDVLMVLVNTKEPLSSKQVEDLAIKIRQENNLPLKGIAGSNIRRQLKRLKDIFLIESINNNYRITENETLERIFEERIEKYYVRSIIDRVKEYFRAVK